MRKIFGLIIKILPLITLYKGVTSGGARLGPLLDTVKVALTQYEVGQVTKLVVQDYSLSGGQLVKPYEFSEFILDNFHSQYSVLARELKGDKKHDHSQDIWGHPFLLLNKGGMVKIVSAGPDGVIETKDDITSEISQLGADTRRAAVPEARPISPEPRPMNPPAYEEEVQDDRAPAAVAYFDNPEVYDSEGYNREGFDQYGYDRDSYDRNGLHRSEKEAYYE
jgi:hypothetical protein